LIVPAWTAAEGLKLVTARARDLMRHLVPDTVVNRADVLNDLGWDETALDDALKELQWLGLVEIPNDHRASKYWRIARVV
jgi:hypothetical protein